MPGLPGLPGMPQQQQQQQPQQQQPPLEHPRGEGAEGLWLRPRAPRCWSKESAVRRRCISCGWSCSVRRLGRRGSSTGVGRAVLLLELLLLLLLRLLLLLSLPRELLLQLLLWRVGEEL